MEMQMMDNNDYCKKALSRGSKMYRLLWCVTRCLFIRPLPRTMGQRWIHFIYRLFGATIGRHVLLYPSASVYDPRNLIMKNNSQIGPDAEIYNVNMIVLEEYAIVSQRVYLCTASHDINSVDFHLVAKPIVIGRNSWVAADAFIGMGVTIGECAVVGARASVFRNVEPFAVVGGNPAKFIRKRVIDNDSSR